MAYEIYADEPEPSLRDVMNSLSALKNGTIELFDNRFKEMNQKIVERLEEMERKSDERFLAVSGNFTTVFDKAGSQFDSSTSEGAMQYFLSRQIAERLLQDKIPQRLLMSIEHKLSKVNTHHKVRI